MRKFNPQVGHSIARSPNNVVPDEMDVELTYPVIGVLNAGAASSVAKVWNPNAAFDVDPVLGSTDTPGFAEWAAFYSYYRVIGYTIDLQTTNRDADAVAVFVINSDTDPGTGGSTYMDKACNPHCAKHLHQQFAGGQTWTFKKHYPVAAITGTSTVETDDTYRALTSGVPADLVWFGLGVQSPGAANLTFGIAYVLYIKMQIRFTGRKTTLVSSSRVDPTSFSAQRMAWKQACGQQLSPSSSQIRGANKC